MELKEKSKLAIFVPEWYLTKSQALRCVEPSRGSFLREVSKESSMEWPDRQESFQKKENFFTGVCRAFGGDIPEKCLYDTLQRRFLKRNNVVAVFHGLNILKLNLGTTFKLSEKDFVIVNATYSYIMVIEVKRTLGAGDSLTTSVNQVGDAKDDLQAWFRSEGLHHWRFVPLIVTLKVEVSLNCDGCKYHIVEGKSTHCSQKYITSFFLPISQCS